MDSLPKELLLYIFTQLSQRSRFRCTLVCKLWHNVITSDSYFYRTIEIYSLSQLNSFINAATKIKIKNNYFGYFVQRLIMEGYFRGDKEINVKTAERLHNACPNIIYINKLPSTLTYKQFNHWKFTHIIEDWYSSMELNWFYQLHQQLISLKIDVNEIMTKTSLLDNNDHHKVQFIIDKKPNQQKPPHDYDDDLIDENGFIQYYGKVLSIPSFNQLKILNIDFSTVFDSSRLNIYEIDERTLLSIHQSCPLLENLTLVALFMNVSTSIKTSLSSNCKKNQLIKIPIYHLKSLTLKWCVLNQTQCYDYFPIIYPYLTTLKMGLKWYSESNNDNKDFQMAIYNMITSFKYLKNLIIDDITKFDSGRSFPMFSSFWPHELLFNWLNRYPQQLDHFRYPFDFTSIKEEQLTVTTTTIHVEPSNSIFLFLNHLTTLEFNADSDFERILLILLKSGTNNKISSTITTLKLYRERFQPDPFPILVWLDFFPKLNHLSLRGIQQIKTDAIIDQASSLSSGLLKYHYLNSSSISLPTYSLKSFKVYHSNFYSKNGLTTICLVCPKLKILELYFSNIMAVPTEVFDYPPIKNKLEKVDDRVIIDAPHLIFDSISLFGCGVNNTTHSFSSNIIGTSHNFIINESNSTTNRFKSRIAFHGHTELVLNCKSVDTIIIR